jgi:hypothetical protein
MCQTYDSSRPIEDLFRQMQDGRAYAQAGQQPYGKHQIINIANALVFNTGVYGDSCNEWEKHDILEKTWENFKAHFTTEHCLYRKHTQTAQAADYQVANNAQRILQDALMVEHSEALAMLASASATDQTTISPCFIQCSIVNKSGGKGGGTRSRERNHSQLTSRDTHQWRAWHS